MAGLFDKRFVHFMWEDELEGKEVICAETIDSLIMQVNNAYDVDGLVRNASSFGDCPFQTVKGNRVYRFVYYDPNYECKRAYAEGKQIQYKFKDEEKWYDVNSRDKENIADEGMSWFDDGLEYRIKPEEPKSRPFEDTAEFILHYQQHFNAVCPPYAEPLIWVKDKDDNRHLIRSYSEKCVFIDTLCLTMKDLFDDYVFLDSSPCGIKED